MSSDSTTEEEEEQGSFIWEIKNYGRCCQRQYFVSEDYQTDNVLWSLMLQKGARVTKGGRENGVMYTVSGFREGREPIRVKIRFLVIGAANVTTLVIDEVFETSSCIIFYKAVFANGPLPNEYLVNGELTLRFDVAISEIKKRVGMSPESSRHKSSVQALRYDIISYLSKQDSGHVVLRVEEEEFRMHKFMLSARSPVFREKLEKVMNVTLTDPISINDVSAAVFNIIARYMYGYELDVPSGEVCIGLYLAAERYFMTQLKTRSATILKKNMSPDIVCDVALMAHRRQDIELRASCKNYIATNADEVFSTKGWEELLAKMPVLASYLSSAV